MYLMMWSIESNLNVLQVEHNKSLETKLRKFDPQLGIKILFFYLQSYKVALCRWTIRWSRPLPLMGAVQTLEARGASISPLTGSN